MRYSVFVELDPAKRRVEINVTRFPGRAYVATLLTAPALAIDIRAHIATARHAPKRSSGFWIVECTRGEIKHTFKCAA